MKKTWLQVNFFQKATLLLLVFLTAICLNVTHSSAADYTAAPTLPLNGAWSSEYWLSDTNHEQWYKLVIPSDGKLTYKVMGYTYVNYRLYNSDLSESPHYWFSSGSETSPHTDGYDVVLSAGTYYFKIYKGNSGKYTFRISPLSQSSCNHDYKTTYINSTYTQQGYTHHQCSKCGHAYNDNYKARLVLNTPSIYLYAGRKRITVSWYSVYNASGYQISYKINGRTRTIKTKGHYKTIKRLKPHKKCVVRVRAYKRAGNQTVYSRWSPKKSVRIQ